MNKFNCRAVLVFGLALGLFVSSECKGQIFDEFTPLISDQYPNARATLFLIQRNGRSRVFVFVRNARPRTLYTVWFRLASESQLTTKTVSPLANPRDIPELAEVTPAGDLTRLANELGLFGEDPKVGSADLANGFHTNRRGNGWFHAELNYPVLKGAFQFNEFHEVLNPIAIGRVPSFALRIAAHPDGTGHGLVPDEHVPSFDWQWDVD